MGLEHAGNTISLADNELADFGLSGGIEPLPFDEAIDFFKGKISLTKDEWNELEPKLRFRAFTVSRLSEADYIEAVRGRLAHALEKGESVSDMWHDIQAIAQADGSSIKPGYWETVYRTNAQTAYNAGRLMQYQNNKPAAWELLIIEDGRTSDVCKGIASLVGNGRALPASHSFWTAYGFPPYHFNCRTTFRAVYNYEIGHGTEVENVPMKQIRKNFKPQAGFGGNLIEKESWWRLTDKMKERIEHYGIKKEVEAAAKSAGIENFDVRLAHNKIKQRRLQGTDFKANIIEGAEPKPHEVEIARILKENGYEVLFTPENNFIQGTKNPEGIIPSLDKVVEMKRITSPRLDKIPERMMETSEQNAQIAVLNLIGKKNYTKADAVSEVRKTFKEAERNLKEVWLILNGKLSKIKK